MHHTARTRCVKSHTLHRLSKNVELRRRLLLAINRLLLRFRPTFIVDLRVDLRGRHPRVAQDHLCALDAEFLADSRRCVVSKLIGTPLVLGFPSFLFFLGRTLGKRECFFNRVANRSAVCCGRVDVAGFPLRPSHDIRTDVVAVSCRCLAIRVAMLAYPCQRLTGREAWLVAARSKNGRSTFCPTGPMKMVRCLPLCAVLCFVRVAIQTSPQRSIIPGVNCKPRQGAYRWHAAVRSWPRGQVSSA